MSNTIKWYYKGTEIYFVSTEENFERHKLQNAARLGITDPEIIITENATTDNPITTSRPCRNCNSSTETKSTIPVDTKATKTTGKTSRGLFLLSGDVDSTSTPTDTVEDNPDIELLGGTIDRVAL